MKLLSSHDVNSCFFLISINPVPMISGYIHQFSSNRLLIFNNRILSAEPIIYTILTQTNKLR